MILVRYISIHIAIAVFSTLAIAQTEGPLILSDQSENLFCTEDVRLKMDSFMLEVQQRPGSIGYIVGSANSSVPGRFNKYFKAFQQHVVIRQFDTSRMKFYRAQDGGSMRFDYWISADGITRPELPEAYRRSAITGATLYDSSLISSFFRDGVEFGHACDWGLDLRHFAMTVNADPNLEAYLIATAGSRSNVNLARQALSLTARELSKDHGLSARRIKTRFVGVRERTEMQLWIAPKGSPVPEFREGMLW
jgi:hypothetical protein